jgi:hypothetical protein
MNWIAGAGMMYHDAMQGRSSKERVDSSAGPRIQALEKPVAQRKKLTHHMPRGRVPESRFPATKDPSR